MRTLTATALLSIMFLSAGAFAGDRNQAPVIAKSTPANVTVVFKNQAWPLPGRISVSTDPCDFVRCIDI